MFIMSEEQKIIDLENEISFLKDALCEKQKEIEEKNIAVNKMSKDISRQLEEIEEKTTIIMAGAEKVKQLEKEIQRLEKDNDTLSELVIVNEDKVIKELDLISKDKIRKRIEEARKIRWHIPKLVIEYFEELLEENNEESDTL